MLAVALRRTVSKVVATTPKTFAIRAFSEERLSIPRDIDQQAGRKREEMDAEAAGQVGFNRDPIIPTDDAGTKENPILVPSGADERAVGYEDPLSHQLQWFNLRKGPLHYVPSIGLYFKLQPIA